MLKIKTIFVVMGRDSGYSDTEYLVCGLPDEFTAQAVVESLTEVARWFDNWDMDKDCLEAHDMSKAMQEHFDPFFRGMGNEYFYTSLEVFEDA